MPPLVLLAARNGWREEVAGHLARDASGRDWAWLQFTLGFALVAFWLWYDLWPGESRIRGRREWRDNPALPLVGAFLVGCCAWLLGLTLGALSRALFAPPRGPSPGTPRPGTPRGSPGDGGAPGG